MYDSHVESLSHTDFTRMVKIIFHLRATWSCEYTICIYVLILTIYINQWLKFSPHYKYSLCYVCVPTCEHVHVCFIIYLWMNYIEPENGIYDMQGISKGMIWWYKLSMKCCTENKSQDRFEGSSTVSCPPLHHTYRHVLISVNEKDKYLTVVGHTLVTKPL